MKKIVLAILLCSNFYASAQILSHYSDISILTVGPGDNLNDSFGHSAIRVKDYVMNYDIVFDYGRYDFNSPNFYLKFARGQLDYQLGVSYFDDFFDIYLRQGRSIDSQTLDLTQEEKQQIFSYLLTNNLPENRAYRYDFFYDNCANRIPLVLEESLTDSLVYQNPKEFKLKTFRDLIYECVDKNSWGSFGIDLALGSVIDKRTSLEDQLFLPKYVRSYFENAQRKGGKKLIKKSENLLEEKPVEKEYSLANPMTILTSFSLILLVLTIVDWKRQKRFKWLDVMLFLTTGLLGVLVLLLWFATDHTATAFNYNFLWAFAPNVLMVVAISRSQLATWMKGYLKFLLLLMALMVLHAITKVQVFSWALFPFCLALAFRYFFLLRQFKKA